MDLGIGLPNAVPGASGDELTEFARRAESRGFPTLGTIDRLVYPNHEPLLALAAAAAVTERIRLMTTVLLGPLRKNTAILAKQAATLSVLSRGRFTLGIALGARPDDYEASGLETKGRGATLDRQLEEMKRIWAGEERGFAGAIGPPTDDGPPVIVGGSVEVSFRRAARFGEGWIMGGGPPDQFAEAVQGVRAAWQEAGRDDEPRLIALGYYSLGADAETNADRYLKDYYGIMGEEVASMIASSAATDAETVRQYLDAFEAAECDELVLFPCSSDPEQADLLADAAGK